jgi:alkanesulfonate monooxygenase SsuD/methylene tetrahydromethanopterin reductase-like flavin-dependent oxidoreductase (luciferase family)
MLRLTARYADAWNTAWFGTPTDELVRRVANLESALQAEGRAPTDLRRTVGMIVRDPDRVTGETDPTTFAGSVDDLAHTIDAYEEMGFHDIVVGVEPMTERSLDRLGKAMELRRR